MRKYELVDKSHNLMIIKI